MRLAWKLRLATIAVAMPTTVACLMLGEGRGSSASIPVPELIELRPGTFFYRANGEFTRDGHAVRAPLLPTAIPRTLTIMKHQVTAADYRRCVNAGACSRTDQRPAAPDRPAVDVSWLDANAYAAWFSRETGAHFRLPTDEEWVYAAGSRFADDGVAQRDPGQRELARYELNARGQEAIDKEPKAIGSFGANENGLLDLAGNVWEWTDTCFGRQFLDGAGDAVATTRYCGIRIAEGRHRSYMIDFIRDAKGGGCSVGEPPTNLGFRLVRDDRQARDRRSLLARIERYLGLGT